MRRTPTLAEISALSREFSLVCDREGLVTWVDERATKLAGIEPGIRLEALAAPGTEEKLGELLVHARAGEVNGWEVPLVLGIRPQTVSFCARPHDGSILLVGSLVSEAFTRTVEHLSGSMEEVVNLNRQVVVQKREIERRHAELQRVNRELSESNDAVVNMHAELSDRAEQLQQTSEIKSRIVSHVGHEFRTPLHSIVGLTRLLLEGTDGPVNAEQAKQVGYIRSAAEELMQFVDDLLDLSRVEAGKASVRLEKFEVGEFLSALRGMLRPLVAPGAPVELLVDGLEAPVTLETDRSKLSQVIRNLVSNAIKFTERGTVRVATTVEDERLRIAVSDTGVGVAPEHLETIFEEFAQIDNPVQSRVKGSGLGLPLSRRLAEMLGGTLTVESELGRGSTFTLTIPLEHAEVREMREMVERSRRTPAGPASILVVEDDLKTLFVYEKYLVMAGFHVIPVRSIDDAREAIRAAKPAAIVLDVMLEGETSWNFLAGLKRDPETHDIPVLVVTVTNREQKARALGADEFWLKPVDQQRLLRRLRAVARSSVVPRVLVIDDDEKARYIVRKHLEGTPYELLEAATGAEGVHIAQREVPHVILLDFLLQEVTAFDVLDELKSDPRTRAIPVIVVTSQALDVVQRERLLAEAEGVISKQSLSRELALNRIRDALAKSGVAVRPQA